MSAQAWGAQCCPQGGSWEQAGPGPQPRRCSSPVFLPLPWLQPRAAAISPCSLLTLAPLQLAQPGGVSRASPPRG